LKEIESKQKQNLRGKLEEIENNLSSDIDYELIEKQKYHSKIMEERQRAKLEVLLNFPIEDIEKVYRKKEIKLITISTISMNYNVLDSASIIFNNLLESYKLVKETYENLPITHLPIFYYPVYIDLEKDIFSRSIRSFFSKKNEKFKKEVDYLKFKAMRYLKISN
jgi:hypothetical protein